MIADEILMLASLLQTGAATADEQRNAAIVAQKIALKVRRLERAWDEVVEEAREDAALPVPVPPVAQVIRFPTRVPVHAVGEEHWR